jgi:hypothetical protein
MTQTVLMLIYIWAGSTPSLETVEFSSPESCEAARAALVKSVSEAIREDPFPQPVPVIICVPK